MAQYTDQERLLYRLDRKLTKAIVDFDLIQDQDRILLALSGGKDSLALVDLLGRRMRIFKPKFSLVAAHISMTNIGYATDLKYLSEHCRQYGIPFLHHVTAFDGEGDTRKSPCFLCSWNRRKALFELAQEHGCNKLALGHHQDDILQTLLMNMTFQGAISTMPPKLVMNKFDMTIIRPMCMIAEEELIQLCKQQDYRLPIKQCPYECTSSRPEMKEVLAKLHEMNPMARHNLWSSMMNIQQEYLPNKI